MDRWPGGSTTRERLRLIHRWTDEGLDSGRFYLRQVKYMTGGMIWAFSEVLGRYWHPLSCQLMDGTLTAAQILALFHATAKDRYTLKHRPSRDDIYDNDLKDLQLESWRSAIRPYRNLWR